MKVVFIRKREEEYKCSPKLVLCMNIRLVLAQKKDDIRGAAESRDVQGGPVVNVACKYICSVG